MSNILITNLDVDIFNLLGELYNFVIENNINKNSLLFFEQLNKEKNKHLDNFINIINNNKIY